MNAENIRVGFIGLGSQGGPMARRIIDAGYPVTLWARRAATLEPFAGTRAKIAGSPAELAAAAGRLLVMAGGDEATVEFCRPVFATYGDPVVHLGPVGAGQVTKLLNNVLFTAHLGAAASLLGLGRALGVDPLRLAGVISHGSGNNFALERVASAGGTLEQIASHAGPLLRKDVGLIADLAAAAGAPGGTVLAAADGALALMNAER
jgi:3-hydroxyisobutyrate dehydrogenase